MAHLESYKRAAAEGVCRHDERHPKDGVKSRKNETIDPEKTALNYNLAPDTYGTVAERIDRICKQEGIRLSSRKDLNVMCSWVVTLPKGMYVTEQEPFFQELYSFLAKRYGENHVITAAVHLDETTPHMHFGFLPVADDGKGGLTVSSKKVVNRMELRKFHRDLSEHMRERFGRDIGIETGITEEQGGNKSVQTMKREAVEAADRRYRALRQQPEIQVEPLKLKKDHWAIKKEDFARLSAAVSGAAVAEQEARDKQWYLDNAREVVREKEIKLNLLLQDAQKKAVEASQTLFEVNNEKEHVEAEKTAQKAFWDELELLRKLCEKQEGKIKELSSQNQELKGASLHWQDMYEQREEMRLVLESMMDDLEKKITELQELMAQDRLRADNAEERIRRVHKTLDRVPAGVREIVLAAAKDVRKEEMQQSEFATTLDDLPIPEGITGNESISDMLRRAQEIADDRNAKRDEQEWNHSGFER